MRNVFLLIFLFASLSFPSIWKEDECAVVEKAVGDMIACDFATAEHISDSMIALHPEEPLYPLLRLCALGLRNLDLDIVVDSAQFMNTYRQTIALIDKRERADGVTSRTMTLRGFADASNASYLMLHRHYGQALGTGLSSLRLLEKALKVDPSNSDPEFFLGFYQYARGELKKRLGPLVFWLPGDRTKGIEQLERCRVKGNLAAAPSAMVLADVYTQEKEFSRSKHLCDELMRAHPSSRFLLWSRARWFEAQKDYRAASTAYGHIADSYAQVKLGDYNMLVTRLLQVELLHKAGARSEAAAIAARYASCASCRADPRAKTICRRLSQYAKDDK